MRRFQIDRRSFLLGSLAVGVSGIAHAKSQTSEDPLLCSARELARRIRHGELGVAEHTKAVIQRMERFAPLNAFISFDPERLLKEATLLDQRPRRRRVGALYGVAVPIKDSVNTGEYPTTAGTKALAQFRPREDAPVVAKLRAAGALVMGKTNLHELSYGWTSNNLAFGAVRNPYGPQHIPGGSSGGTAAAVAACLAPFGVAEDTEGSIRVPAALCGLLGFRPTTGRYSTEGAVPISAVFDQIGPVARHADDLWLFDELVGPPDAPIQRQRLKGLRVGVIHDPFWGDLHPDVAACAAGAIGRLKQHGVTFIDCEFPELEPLVTSICEPIQNHDVRVGLESFLRRYEAGVDFNAVVKKASTDIRSVFEHDVMPGSPGFVTEERYRQMTEIELPNLRWKYAEFFRRTGVHAVVFPTTRVTAPLIGDEDTVDIGGRRIDFGRAVAGNIAAGSTTGLPGLVLPIGQDRCGLPMSLEFDAPSGSDRFLLGLAPALQQALGSLKPPDPHF